MNTARALREALVRAKTILDPQVRNILNNSTWPEEVTMQLQLQVMDRRIGLYIPAELRKTVDDLEYGTLSKGPTFVLRAIDELVDRVTGEEIARVLNDFMFSEVL